MIVLTFFFYGLLMGSFLNVVLVRTEKEESFFGRSHCPRCQVMIHWYDNIPLLSFFILRGRCRSCGERISWQYPLVELATGALFTLAALLVFDPLSLESKLTTFWWCFLFAILLIITVYDLRHMEIPLSFLLWGIGGTLVYFLVKSLITSAPLLWSNPLFQALVGGMFATVFFYALVFVSKERWMGMGDVWLGFLSGMAVGPRQVFLLITLSFTLGALVALTLLLLGKKELGSKVPFAPYLCVATLILLVFSVRPPVWLHFFLFPPF